MSETPQEPQPQPQPAEGGQPSMRVLTQYLKDLSFESPAAPASLGQNLAAPQMEVSVDVNGRALGQNRFEVELSCSATARRDGNIIYVCEVNYAGLFLIENVPEDRLEPLLLVDAPHMLFPFVRQIVAQSSRDGGFQPLLLEPLDFLGMYQHQRMQRQGQAPQAAPGVTTGPAPEGPAEA
ncbi:protein-export chaperone SecB [Parvularcula sp. ZS-1/3]|uniref:Protein-export protein SecB n=1 Tax=Parvularcula mediterranea TaxID=2732508 RepID=A0A7Y3RKC5_9PROT|nr:protein-export chaperone SecB [Parvularcula mediterranea]NNU15595.1 protein-export chaperone SecB [Parvularcula mediterranea]